MDEFRFIAERKIREAMEEGAFDHLEGTGRPIALDENPFEDPSQRLANRILKNNGLSPAWILEAKEIEAEALRLRNHVGEPPADYRKRVAALNRRIAAFNLKAPVRGFHKPLFPAGR